jgi:hypothetical protein
VDVGQTKKAAKNLKKSLHTDYTIWRQVHTTERMELREATFRQAQGVVVRVRRKGERLNVWEGGEQRRPAGNTKCSYGGEGIVVERTSEAL